MTLARLTILGIAHQCSTPIAFAQDTSDTRSVKPLDQFRERLLNAKDNARNVADQLRDTTRLQLDSATTPGQRREFLKEAERERVEMVQERTQEVRQAASTVKGRVRQHEGLVRERFMIAIRQFREIAARLESRIEKLRGAGLDTAQAESRLAAARLAISDAEQDIGRVTTYIENAPDADPTTRQELKRLKDEAQVSIRSAHAALREVVRALVAIIREESENAATTTTN